MTFQKSDANRTTLMHIAHVIFITQPSMHILTPTRGMAVTIYRREWAPGNTQRCPGNTTPAEAGWGPVSGAAGGHDALDSSGSLFTSCTGAGAERGGRGRQTD